MCLWGIKNVKIRSHVASEREFWGWDHLVICSHTAVSWFKAIPFQACQTKRQEVDLGKPSYHDTVSICITLHPHLQLISCSYLQLNFYTPLPLLRYHCMFAFARVRHCAQCLHAVSKRLFLLKQLIQPTQERTSSYKVISWLTEHLPQYETERLQKCDVRVVTE